VLDAEDRLHRIERAGADVSEDDPDGAERQREGPAAAVRRSW
jgi:hypothetical protein